MSKKAQYRKQDKEGTGIDYAVDRLDQGTIDQSGYDYHGKSRQYNYDTDILFDQIKQFTH